MPTTTSDGFADGYSAARAAFSSAARTAHAIVETLALDARGPQHEPLGIDIARLGPNCAERALLVLSGTHGVEGFAGSAVQTAYLASSPSVPPDAAVLLVHAINPWGFAHLRRVNENNVDLNRNFLRAGERYEGAPAGYRRLDHVLNPPSPPARDAFWMRAGALVVRHGIAALRQAVAEGQYEFPRGLFFGGHALEEGPRKLLAWIEANLAGLRTLRVLDLHTGLGPFGAFTLFADPATAPDTSLRAVLPAGVRVVHESAAAGAGGYATRGELSGKLREVLPGVRAAYYTVEIGTCGNLRILHAMREENRCHHFGGGAPDHPAKRRLVEVFRPRSPAWRRTVLRNGVALIAASL